ncbi:flagellin lysine-N-methylase [Brevibacillus choshinensis]|uniref:Flagellin lysine-N-methylase n=1 Tax=Brevibacillus choshinensis TaxID=54911 RepID=A0ABX7FML8_BRECH|nr:flagellin lysine-N-methylase [Brevibacillus choshinensis]QRG67316.1 flagellin lysine-N-methylase [Brevibacillus choshinensis]
MTIKMVDTLIPEYMKEFSCIGSACEDTCCSGWRVDIDEVTYKKYKRVDNLEMKAALEKNVIRNRSNPTSSNVAKMKMRHLKCSFLDNEGLCSIQLKLGEDYLSNTCTVYPRRINKVNGMLERSLTVSCPEATRLVLLKPDGIKFEQNQEVAPSRNLTSVTIDTPEKVSHWKDFFNEYRYVTISILQNRKHSLEDRLLILGMLYNELEEYLQDNKIEQIPSLLGRYLDCVEDETFIGEFNNIPNRLEIKLRLCRELVVLRLTEGITSARFLECSRDMISGLKIEANLSEDEINKNYEYSFGKFYSPFIKNHEYMLENYLVNYVFKNCFPIDCDSPFESYARMVVLYSLIKLHLIGMANHYEGLSSDHVIKLIQSLSKTFEHNGQVFEKLMNLLKENKFITLTYMSILIKN